MTRITLEISIPSATLRKIDSLVRGPATDCRRDELFHEEVAEFHNGMHMLVQAICSGEPNDGGWTQGVLFAPGGGFMHEVGCTDVGESFTGTYIVPHDGIEYVVVVKPEKGGDA